MDSTDWAKIQAWLDQKQESEAFKDPWHNRVELETEAQKLVEDIKSHLFDEKIEELP